MRYMPMMLSLCIVLLMGCSSKHSKALEIKLQCAYCSSMIIREPSGKTKPYYMTKSSKGCEHLYRNTISSALPTRIKDGTVVLLRNRNAYAVLILKGQSTSLKNLQYNWWYRDDGSGVIESSEKNVESGEGYAFQPKSRRGDLVIEFKDFRLDWSASGEGLGYLLYPYFPSDTTVSNAIGICVTSYQDVNGLDASDTSHIYEYLCPDPDFPSKGPRGVTYEK